MMTITGITIYKECHYKKNLKAILYPFGKSSMENFFGDLHCSSRFTDMLCDTQAQYGDYSELEKCPMWGMWVKERGKLDKGLTENRRESVRSHFF